MIEAIEISLVVIGIVGCLVPGIPGIPLVFAGILVQEFFDPNVDYPFWVLLLMALFTLLIILAQYYIPIWGTKRFGASKVATQGAFVGLIFGIFSSFLGPFGIFIGPFLGAFLAELFITGKDFTSSFIAGFGAFLGILASAAFELIGAIGLSFIFFWNLFS